jgi:OmpA-OmpF porin, OOP family
MKHPALRCIVAASLLSGVCPTYAAGSYWYTGIGVGYSRVKFYSADFSSGGAASERKKEFDAGFKGSLGYQINRNWAAEVSYVSLGNFQYAYEAGGVTQQDFYQVTGWGFSAVPTVPFTNNFSVFGRFGGFFSQTRITIRNPGTVISGTIPNFQTDETSFVTGFGAQYFFNVDTGVRIEYENFGKVGNASCATCTGRANAGMASINAIFKF